MHAAVLEVRRAQGAELHARVRRAHVLAHVEFEDEVGVILVRDEEAVRHSRPRRADDGAVDHFVIRAAAEHLPALQRLAVEDRRASRLFSGRHDSRGEHRQDEKSHSNPLE